MDIEYIEDPLGDHLYITSAHFWTFSEPPTHYVSINTELNVSKNCHFLNPSIHPTQFFCWRNIGMAPKVFAILESVHKKDFFDYSREYQIDIVMTITKRQSKYHVL